MASILENFKKVKASLPNDVTLVVVSKTKPIESIMEVYQSGHRIFGENKVQELTEKHAQLPQDIKWHFIGHLQTNKVKYIAPFVDLIHAVDSPRLLKEINKQGAKNDRVISCLLQAKIAQEESKYGLSFDAICTLLANCVTTPLPYVKIEGLMAMATNTQQEAIIRKELNSLYTFFNEQKEKYAFLNTLSIGMSNDYPIAIEEGSTMVRVGSAIYK